MRWREARELRVYEHLLLEKFARLVTEAVGLPVVHVSFVDPEQFSFPPRGVGGVGQLPVPAQVVRDVHVLEEQECLDLFALQEADEAPPGAVVERAERDGRLGRLGTEAVCELPQHVIHARRCKAGKHKRKSHACLSFVNDLSDPETRGRWV